MQTHSLHEARAGFSKLIDRALAGEPQRVTRRGKDAVIVVSEREWNGGRPTKRTLGSVLADFARTRGFSPSDFDRPYPQRRPLGSDFE